MANIRWGKANNVTAESQLVDETRAGTRGSYDGGGDGEDTGAIDARGNSETMEDNEHSLTNEASNPVARVTMEEGETSSVTTEDSESCEDSEATTETAEEESVVMNECETLAYTETPVTTDSNAATIYVVATETTLPQEDNEVQVRFLTYTIKTHGSVSCGPRSRRVTPVSILTGRKKTQFSHLRSSVLP